MDSARACCPVPAAHYLDLSIPLNGFRPQLSSGSQAFNDLLSIPLNGFSRARRPAPGAPSSFNSIEWILLKLFKACFLGFGKPPFNSIEWIHSTYH